MAEDTDLVEPMWGDGSPVTFSSFQQRFHLARELVLLISPCVDERHVTLG